MRRFGAYTWVLVLYILLILFSWTAYAQATPPVESTGTIPERIAVWLLVQPAVITLVVNAIKGVKWVSDHPKAAAAILNTLGILAGNYLFGVLPGGALATFLQAVATSFGSSGFYEWSKGPISIVIPPKS